MTTPYRAQAERPIYIEPSPVKPKKPLPEWAWSLCIFLVSPVFVGGFIQLASLTGLHALFGSFAVAFGLAGLSALIKTFAVIDK